MDRRAAAGRRGGGLTPAGLVADIPAHLEKRCEIMKADANPLDRPRPIASKSFRDPEAAVERLELIYDRHTAFIRERFARLLKTKRLDGRVRATYPEIRIETSSFAKIDSRLSYGHVAGPGVYSATVTQPKLFRSYLVEQIRLLIRNHGVPVEIGPSAEPIPLHFAFPDGIHVEGELTDRIDRPLRDMFDVPDLAVDRRRHRQRHLRRRRPACRCRWRRSPRRGSTIRSIACRTTRRRIRSISRTS